jgi:hypothetical protein
MADKEYVSLSVEPLAREELRLLVIQLSAAVGYQLTMSEAITISAKVTSYALKSGGGAFDRIFSAAEDLRTAKSGGCE